ARDHGERRPHTVSGARGRDPCARTILPRGVGLGIDRGRAAREPRARRSESIDCARHASRSCGRRPRRTMARSRRAPAPASSRPLTMVAANEPVLKLAPFRRVVTDAPVSYSVYSAFSFYGERRGGELAGPWIVRALESLGHERAAIRQTL